jgi:hypothetical protein
MNTLIDKMFGANEVTPPSYIRESFLMHFRENKNEEWNRRNKDWEVIFYFEERECIALFDGAGKLKELKTVLNIDQLPELIVNQVRKLGETMNIIEIKNDLVITYEIIYRDPQMNRQLCVLDENGNVMHHKTL